MLTDFDSKKTGVVYANSTDVCVFCAEKIAKEKKIGRRFASKELEGKLFNKKVLAIPTYIDRVVICENCLKKALSQFNSKHSQ